MCNTLIVVREDPSHPLLCSTPRRLALAQVYADSTYAESRAPAHVPAFVRTSARSPPSAAFANFPPPPPRVGVMCDCECGHHDWEDDDSVHGELVYGLHDRPIRPLPKRQRLSPSPQPSPTLPLPAKRTPSGHADDLEDGRASGDVESGHPADHRAARRHAPAPHPSRDLDTTDGALVVAETACTPPQRKRSESPSAPCRPRRPDSTGEPGSTPADSTKTFFSPGLTSDSPPTSPASHSFEGSDPAHRGQSEAEGPAPTDEPTTFGLFGADGFKIAKSLSSASSFSTAGLFGGLGLASLHPQVGVSANDEFEEYDEEDGDEDTYGVVDRSRPPVEPSRESTVAATALGLGESNKKKRKVPGLNAAPTPAVQAATAASESTGGRGQRKATAAVARTEVAPPPPPPLNRTRAREEEPSPTRGDARPVADDWLPLRAPVNPPTTAKAALAKLRVRPPHVSLCATCSSTRRFRRKKFRTTCSKQEPLPLPTAPAFVPPAMPREGPPKLPPGSGLKGSKALKAAAKMAKEREKEKERIRKLFGGVQLPNLWDPEEKENPLPQVVTRLIAREVAQWTRSHKVSATAKVGGGAGQQGKESSGYPTPPASSDEGESDDGRLPASGDTLGTLNLAEFRFHADAPELVQKRWVHLQDQKERLKAAKERAAKARDQEKARRKEKAERERVEKEKKAAAAAAAPAPPTPAATPRRAASASLPTAGPTSSSPRYSRSTHPSASPSDAPLAPPPASALPPPPNAATSAPTPTHDAPRRAPLKKGRKKRSAHANAQNVHHRDNYVPSRLPFASPPLHPSASSPFYASPSDPSQAHGPTSWPASDEATAAAGPYAHTCGGGHFCGPDEWLCLFCEYEVFYGEPSALLRAVRKRKGVLKVRRKAQERATKATSGHPPVQPPPPVTTSSTSPAPRDSPLASV
ncbi:hypothetical protein JCM10212_006975 [Sporobolomyces blumeae]